MSIRCSRSASFFLDLAMALQFNCLPRAVNRKSPDSRPCVNTAHGGAASWGPSGSLESCSSPGEFEIGHGWEPLSRPNHGAADRRVVSRRVIAPEAGWEDGTQTAGAEGKVDGVAVFPKFRVRIRKSERFTVPSPSKSPPS